jgi:protein-S-isoprenylcysteine O-methyltransferase Ste14
VTPASENRTPAQRLLRWGLPVLVIGLGLLLVAEGYRLPLTQAYAGIGPGFLVLVIGLALLLLWWRDHAAVTHWPIPARRRSA